MIHVAGPPLPAGEALQAQPGDVIVLRGPNGSGKTSLLRALAGLPAPVGPAAVTLLGDTLDLAPAERRTWCRAAWQDALDGLVGLTVAGESRLRGLPSPVGPLAGRAVATLSSGEARRAALAVVRAQAGPLVLLDEPVEGLDAQGRQALLDWVAKAPRRGDIVVAADHTGTLEAVASRILDLAPAHSGVLEPLPAPPSGPPVVVAGTFTSARGVGLPAVALGPGLHVVTGPNGCGKSTLLLRLAGLLEPHGVRVQGRPPEPGQNVRLLLPRARDHLWRATLGEELAGVPAATAQALGVSALAGRRAGAHSGGEAQRLALAKLFARPAPLLLLDEPEAHLDEAGRVALRGLVADAVAAGSCVLAATHDEAIIRLAHSRLGLEAP